jgi:flagellar basal-body rod protein FlgB
MLNDLFGNVNLLQKGLDAAWARNEVITNNIANVDTPDFKSSSVNFETAMKQALEADDNRFSAKTTREEHYDFSNDSVDNVTPTVVKNTDKAYRSDGNNVDIDYENVELAKNTLMYDTLVRQVSSEFIRLKTVING